MSLPIALLLSLMLHLVLVVAPTWLAPHLSPRTPRIEAHLVPLPTPSATAEDVSTEARHNDTTTAPQRDAPPRSLQGRALHRAQSALSKHLFYPPQAVAQGLEGEVILLLVLSENGQLVAASIARGSGHALLDQAALDAAHRIGALPGNPRQTLFPVRFSLQ